MRPVWYGLAAAALITTIAPAQALTEKQISEKLKNIPVFVVINTETREPIVVTLPEKEGKPAIRLVNFFLNPTEAKQFLGRIQEKDKTVGAKTEVRVSSLALAYAAFQSQRKEKKVEIVVAPADDEVKQAREILKRAQQDPSKFVGIPLFFPAQKKEGKISPLTLQVPGDKGSKRDVTPMYFDYSIIAQQLEQARKKDQSITSAYVELSTLDQMVELLSKGDESLSQSIELVPAKDALEAAPTYKFFPEASGKPAAKP
ncbi:Tic22 family protein [Anthocerotibacter panamensis]|uniref:Tic22 family protein n=1 Tax=Anthocerotibacter panamensis TaxID=2857077 RepID=UPI001C403711|nr:Tic22 family protein [Anthocerotibacter panamensis]